MSEASSALEDQIKEHAQALMDKIDSGPSEYYQNWLKVTSRFWRYSFGNQLLIAAQMPEATHVASFGDWLKKHKNPVAKGQKSKIHILAPYRKKVTDEEGREYWRVVGFGIGHVFDVSQTVNPDYVPEFFTKLGESHASLIPTILAAMGNDGIVVECGNAGSAQGYSANKKVVYTDDDADNQITTLVHEWAHELNHWGEDRSTWTKSQKECHAEGISYIVCQALGIDTPYSADYIINHRNTVEDFRRELDIITKGAKNILSKLSASNAVQKEEAA